MTATQPDDLFVPTPRELPSSAQTKFAETRSNEADVPYFRTFGFVVLRQFFDPRAIAIEIDHVMHDGAVSSLEASIGAGIRFQYVPMMTAETPNSLSLLDRAGAVAETLLGGPVIPTRAKGVYWGSTPWHADCDLPVASVGVAAYLESLGAHNGALRVMPGSHRPEFGTALWRARSHWHACRDAACPRLRDRTG